MRGLPLLSVLECRLKPPQDVPLSPVNDTSVCGRPCYTLFRGLAALHEPQHNRDLLGNRFHSAGPETLTPDCQSKRRLPTQQHAQRASGQLNRGTCVIALAEIRISAGKHWWDRAVGRWRSPKLLLGILAMA